ncbi:MAG: PAS domain-containing protein [Planctomycetia bacterium]|nr:PAS domain-containing protein [Planctomycetia bacterium]
MNNTILSTKDKSKALIDVQDEKGWCEYEPSYDGVITHINTAGARIFGFASPDDVIGKKINELYAHPFDHEKTLSMLFREGQVNGFFTLMKTRNDRLFFIKQTSSLITEGLYKCPLKIKSEFEPVQSRALLLT